MSKQTVGIVPIEQALLDGFTKDARANCLELGVVMQKLKAESENFKKINRILVKFERKKNELQGVVKNLLIPALDFELQAMSHRKRKYFSQKTKDRLGLLFKEEGTLIEPLISNISALVRRTHKELGGSVTALEPLLYGVTDRVLADDTTEVGLRLKVFLERVSNENRVASVDEEHGLLKRYLVPLALKFTRDFSEFMCKFGGTGYPHYGFVEAVLSGIRGPSGEKRVRQLLKALRSLKKNTFSCAYVTLNLKEVIEAQECVLRRDLDPSWAGRLSQSQVLSGKT